MISTFLQDSRSRASQSTIGIPGASSSASRTASSDGPPVKRIDASREAVEGVFQHLRESHREWERNRLPDRFF